MKAFVAVVGSLLLAGCAGMRGAPATDNTAKAELRNTSGQPVGTATLTQVGSVVRVVLEVRGLPRGPHGVHIHAVGKCDPPDFNSAGPHFNPAGRQHGALNPQGAHAGDLPNIEVGADGRGRLESTTELISLISGTTAIFDADGSAIVVHAAPDDFRTDPTGNSGARIACGVIAKP
jgi:Cu-Zn family superoxide dismutase